MPTSVEMARGMDFYRARADEASLSMGVLRNGSSESLFFLSADTENYHQLLIDGRLPKATADFAPLLSRTPGLRSLVLLDDQHSVRALRNRPGDTDRLQTLTFLRDKGPLAQDAAFYVHSEGSPSPLEGGLLRWWNEMNSGFPPVSVPMEDVVAGIRRIGHEINNGMSPVIFNVETSELTLAALSKLISALDTIPAFQRAFKKAVNSEAAGEAWDELVDLLPRDLRNPRKPLSTLREALRDLCDLNEHTGSAAMSTALYVREVQRRIPTELPIGAVEMRTLLRECEQVGAEKSKAAEASPVTVDNGPPRFASPLLLVDDDEDVRTLLSDRFKTTGFDNVVAASSLTQALREADKIPDLRLIVSDFNLSETETGLDLIRVLRKRIPGLRAVLISGNVDELRERLTAEEAAAFDVFSKPLDVSNLIERLKSLSPKPDETF